MFLSDYVMLNRCFRIRGVDLGKKSIFLFDFIFELIENWKTANKKMKLEYQIEISHGIEMPNRIEMSN